MLLFLSLNLCPSSIVIIRIFFSFIFNVFFFLFYYLVILFSNFFIYIILLFYHLYSLLNKNKKIAQKCFGSKSWVHKKTFRSSSCIPAFNQNKNELKIKTKVKLYSQKIKLYNEKLYKKMRLINFKT